VPSNSTRIRELPENSETRFSFFPPQDFFALLSHFCPCAIDVESLLLTCSAALHGREKTWIMHVFSLLRQKLVYAADLEIASMVSVAAIGLRVIVSCGRVSMRPRDLAS